MERSEPTNPAPKMVTFFISIVVGVSPTTAKMKFSEEKNDSSQTLSLPAFMKFIYKNCKLPDEPALMQKLENAATKLEEKMRKLDYQSLPISVYAKRYYAYD